MDALTPAPHISAMNIPHYFRPGQSNRVFQPFATDWTTAAVEHSNNHPRSYTWSVRQLNCISPVEVPGSEAQKEELRINLLYYAYVLCNFI